MALFIKIQNTVNTSYLESVLWTKMGVAYKPILGMRLNCSIDAALVITNDMILLEIGMLDAALYFIVNNTYYCCFPVVFP